MRTLTILFIAFCFAPVLELPLSAQLPRDSGVRWASAPSVPARTISGMVSDAFTGQPLRNTAVTAGTSSVVTDSFGRFAIVSKAGASVELYVQRIGYEPMRGRLQMPSETGLLVHVGLNKSESFPCKPVVTYAERFVSVRVRDAVTGRAPDVLVALNVARAGKAASVKGQTKGAPFVLLEVPTDTGRYEFNVQANGYALWRLEDVAKEDGQCRTAKVRPYNVWLLPIRPAEK